MAKRMKKKKSSNAKKKKRTQTPRNQQSVNVNIPMYDFFEDHRAGTSNWDPGECINSLIMSIEDGYFVIWDAVVRKEQGLSLSNKQEEFLYGLISLTHSQKPAHAPLAAL